VKRNTLNSWKLYTKSHSQNFRATFFCERLIKFWNKLSAETDFFSLNKFKHAITNYLHGLFRLPSAFLALISVILYKQPLFISRYYIHASEMTYIVSGGALNSTHSLALAIICFYCDYANLAILIYLIIFCVRAAVRDLKPCLSCSLSCIVIWKSNIVYNMSK